MANLTQAFRWVQYAPDLGENLSLPEKDRLWLEVANGLTSKQLTDTSTALAATKWGEVDGLVSTFAPFVRVVGSNTVNGLPLATLGDYFALITNTATRGAGPIAEMFQQLLKANTVEGELELFSQRRSGGGATTGGPSVVKDESQTAAQ